VAGRRHSCDPRWVAEEWADDHDTLGKTTAKTRGLATRKENENGRANRRLGGGEQRAVSHLVVGKEKAKGKNLWPRTLFIGEGERETVRNWVHPSAMKSVEPLRDARSPVPGMTHAQATIHLGWAQFINPRVFSIFQTNLNF
jgi:hypothetical protein